MFQVDTEDIQDILEEFGVTARAVSVQELQRYSYEEDDPDSREVRLISKVLLADGRALVARFKWEADVSRELVEAQCRFASLLREHGILTPMQYRAGDAFAVERDLRGYRVIITLEDFAEGELKSVTEEAAERTGRLLARMHSIAELWDAHVENAVLFDPFAENDLFKYEEFRSIGEGLSPESQALHRKIVETREEYMALLAPLRAEPRWAVQGDISDCNLYRREDGEIGVFDFNRSGDNNLFCDAVMQAVFEARLMEYPEDCPADHGQRVFEAFLGGYCGQRPFSALHRKLFPYLYALIRAFWASDILWDEHSLVEEHGRGDHAAVHRHLERIWSELTDLRAAPVSE